MSNPSIPTLLLVRPEPRLPADIRLCREAGRQPLPLPLLRIVADETALARLPQQLNNAIAVFWVSPTAVECAAALAGSLNRAVPHIAVGTATAAALKRLGVRQVECAQEGNDSEAALHLPLWSRLPPGSRILIVRGADGRDWLAQQLCRRGLSVEFADIYRRVPQTAAGLGGVWTQFQAALAADSPPQAVWITSSQLVRLLFDLPLPERLAQNLRSLLYFVHHERIAEALRAQGVHRIQCVSSLRDALDASESFCRSGGADPDMFANFREESS